jgi:hypothetical protein
MVIESKDGIFGTTISSKELSLLQSEHVSGASSTAGSAMVGPLCMFGLSGEALLEEQKLRRT